MMNAAPRSPPRSPSPPLFQQTPGTEFDPQYSQNFTNDLMQKVLKTGNAKHSGIAVTTKNVSANASGNSVHIADVDKASLPEIEPHEIPLPLDDSRRIYNSSLPSVKLTHPGGRLEGGPGPEDGEQIARAFAKQHNFRTQTSMHKFIKDETRRQVAELKAQMQARQEAIEHNDKITKEIQQLEAQRETERRLENRMMQEAKTRRESM